MLKTVLLSHTDIENAESCIRDSTPQNEYHLQKAERGKFRVTSDIAYLNWSDSNLPNGRGADFTQRVSFRHREVMMTVVLSGLPTLISPFEIIFSIEGGLYSKELGFKSLTVRGYDRVQDIIDQFQKGKLTKYLNKIKKQG